MNRTPLRRTAMHTRRRDTGPKLKTRLIVLNRDRWACARCGAPAGPATGAYSIQHRKARGVGGDNSLSNLLVLCGSATTGCHGDVEGRDRHDQAKGYWIESWQDPETEPVMYFSESGSGFTAWLLDNGSLSFEPPEAVA